MLLTLAHGLLFVAVLGGSPLEPRLLAAVPSSVPGDVLIVGVPHYPVVAPRARISGVVEVAVIVDGWGEVEHVELVGKGLPLGLTEGSLFAARSWRFRNTGTERRHVLRFEFALYPYCAKPEPAFEQTGLTSLRVWARGPALTEYVMHALPDGTLECGTAPEPCDTN